MRNTPVIRCVLFQLTCVAMLGCVSPIPSLAQTQPNPPLALRDAIQTALLHNRALQIERINPEVARSTLSAAYGFYDPLVTAQVREENVGDLEELARPVRDVLGE